MNSNSIIVITPTALQELITKAVSDGMSAAANQRKEKKLMTTNEICEFLSISLSTLNKWKAENIIPFKKMGRRVYYDRSEVKKAMEDNNYSKLKNLELNDEC